MKGSDSQIVNYYIRILYKKFISLFKKKKKWSTDNYNTRLILLSFFSF